MSTITSRTWTNKGGAVTTRWTLAFTDDFGQRRRRDFKTQREANRFREGLSERLKAGEFSTPLHAKGETPRPKTVRDAAEAYLQAKASGVAGSPLEPRTLIEYQQRIRNHLLPAIGDMPLEAVTRKTMLGLTDTLVKRTTVRRSATKDLFLAKAVLHYALDREWITADPTVRVQIKQDRRQEEAHAREVPIHTKEEVTAILAAAAELRKGTGKMLGKAKAWERWEPMLHLMIFAGLRMSELRGMPVKGFDPVAQTVTVSQRADLLGNIGAPKSRFGYRTIHVPKGTAALLEEWIAKSKPNSKGLLFGTDSGKPVSHTNVSRRLWRAVQQKASVRILNPHAARHFYASLLIDQGASMKVLQESVGHHDPMFTMRVYGHLFKDASDVSMREDMAARMEATLVADDE